MSSSGAADPIASEGVQPAEALCLPDNDWLQHRLTIRGPVAELAPVRAAAAGAGVIPWQLDFEQLRENWFHRLMAIPSRTLSASGARILAQQLREASERRHVLAVAQVGRSRACPFDLHALSPVPKSVLALGPDHPQALAWLWQHWGTTQALRHVVVLAEPYGPEAVGPGRRCCGSASGRRTGHRGGRWRRWQPTGRSCASRSARFTTRRHEG
nr:hypothetical protein [uncultured Lichenicoccus sp.]